MINIEGINYNDMQERLQCDEDTCQLIIETFQKEVIDKLNRLLIEEDNDQFITLAHGIKGSCANVSALECSEIAKTIEYKAREFSKDACKEEVKLLNLKLKELTEHIENYFMLDSTSKVDDSNEDDLFFLKL